MEPLNPKIQIAAEYILNFFYLILVLLPLLHALFGFGLEISTDYLSPVFFLVLFKSALFAITEASLSVAAVVAFSFLLASLKLFLPTKPWVNKIFDAVGILSFSLSPTLVSLAFIMSYGSLFKNLPSGLGAIVFCHFLMNAAFFSSLFQKRLSGFFTRYGAELRILPDALGATKFQKIALLVWPAFKADFKTWAPQMFLWCFMSFSPIVLLASSSQQNTPELLLFYSLLNDPSGARMLIIFLFTAGLSLLLNRSFAKLRKNDILEESYSSQKTPGTTTSSSMLLVLISLILAFPFLYSILSPFFYKNSFSFSTLLPVLGPTLIIFMTSFVVALFAGLLSILCRKEQKIISYCNFISSPMILLGSFRYLSDANKTLSFFLVAVGAFLAVLPWFHKQITSSAERLSHELKLLSVSLGMKNYSYFKNFLWPELGPTVLRFSLLISLWSLGEYTFSKAILSGNSTLALLIDENLRRYQFADASLALSLTLFLSLIAVLFVLWKGERRVAV